MNQNPYRPPESDLSERKPKIPSRPFAVWLFLALLTLMTASVGYGLMVFIWGIITHFDQVVSYLYLTLAMFWRLMLLVVFIWIIASILQRKRWSRWIAVVVLGVATACSIFSTKNLLPDDAIYNPGVIGGFIVVLMIFGFWIYFVAFTAKAKRYFGVQE